MSENKHKQVIEYKFTKACFVLLILFSLLFGFALFTVSYLSFTTLKSNVDLFTIDGSADAFTIVFYSNVQKILRFTGIIFLFAACVFYFNKRIVINYGDKFLYTLLCFVKELKCRFAEVLKEENKIHLYALCAIILFTIVVRIFFLFQPMRYDEAFTFMRYASKPFYIGLSYYETPNNHIFHTFLVHIVYSILGDQPWAIRLPAFITGILMVAVSYLLIRILYNKYAAILTAGFVASSSALIEFSTNARGYILICLISLVILGFVTYLKERRNSAVWLSFIMFSAIGFYTIPIMLYPFGIAIMWFGFSIVFKDSKLHTAVLVKKLLVSIVLVLICTFILYIPAFMVTGFKSVVANQFVESRPLSDFLSLFPASLLSVWKQWHRDIPSVVRLLLVIGFFISLILHRRLANHCIPIILAVIIFCIPVLVVQRVIPYTRVWLFLLPLYLGFASAGIEYAMGLFLSKFRRIKVFVFNIAVVIFSLWLAINVIHNQSILYSTDTGTLKDAEQIAVFLKNYLESGDRVFTLAPSEAPLEYYFKIHDIPISYLYADLKQCRRVIIVVNEAFHVTIIERQRKKQSIGELLDALKSHVVDLGVLRIIKHYELATLYEINRANLQ